MKKAPILHPFLLAIFPVLFLFSHNIGEVLFSETLLPAAVILIFTVILLLSLRFILKDNQKAAILASIFLLIFFSYGHVHTVINKFMVFRHRFLLAIIGISFSCCAYFIIRTRRNLNNATNFLNIVGFALVLISLSNIFTYKAKNPLVFKNREIVNREEFNKTDAQEFSMLPDIYYIILDAYVASSTLKETLGYDNSEFIKYLTNKGFYIASESCSNYARTNLSLCSSLNMEYININYLSSLFGSKKDVKMLIQMAQNNRVMRFLKGRGYKFVHFDTWCGITNHNRYADLDFSKFRYLNTFTMGLMGTSMLKAIYDYFSIYISRPMVSYVFSKLAEMPNMKGPNFIFAHIIAPHPPYVFGPDGEKVRVFKATQAALGAEQCDQFYLGQLIFINKKVRVLIDEILAKSDIPPIIILQADHGWPFTMTLNPFSKKSLRERMRIFNAYYLPKDGRNLLYESITPVNSFRLIFKYYFAADIDLLEDRSYLSPYDHPYEFIDVTDNM